MPIEPGQTLLHYRIADLCPCKDPGNRARSIGIAPAVEDGGKSALEVAEVPEPRVRCHGVG